MDDSPSPLSLLSPVATLSARHPAQLSRLAISSFGTLETMSVTALGASAITGDSRHPASREAVRFAGVNPLGSGMPYASYAMRAEHGSSARVFQTSIFSAMSSASSTSTPR
jgi:hypothetical protein